MLRTYTALYPRCILYNRKSPMPDTLMVRTWDLIL